MVMHDIDMKFTDLAAYNLAALGCVPRYPADCSTVPHVGASIVATLTQRSVFYNI